MHPANVTRQDSPDHIPSSHKAGEVHPDHFHNEEEPLDPEHSWAVLRGILSILPQFPNLTR